MKVSEQYSILNPKCSAGSAPLVAPGKREDVLDRFTCHTAICPDSMGFYSKITAYAKVAQVSTAAAAVIGLWYSLEFTVRQASVEATHVAALLASLTLSAGMGQIFQWLQGQFEYVYQPKDQQKDLAKLTDLVTTLTSSGETEPIAGFRP